MPASPATTAPTRQLGRFVLIAFLLLATWNYIVPIYLTAILPLTNSLFAWKRLPLTMQMQDGQLLVACRQLDGTLYRFLFAGHDMTLLAAAAAFALFAATPGYELRWRLGWIAGITFLFGLINALILSAGAQLAFLDYLGELAPEYHRQLLATGTNLPDAEQQMALESWIGMWSIWGNPALLLIAWFIATRKRYLPIHRSHRLPV